MPRLRVIVLCLALIASACGSTDAGTSDGVDPIEGYRVDRVLDGLVGPTQAIMGPDGRLWVAQLNGGESDGDGQIVAIEIAVDESGVTTTGEPEVLLDGLLKPTGIAVLDDFLWVQERRTLVRYSIDGDSGLDPDDRRVLFDDLPFNGRSEGTLATRDGQLVWITTGTGGGANVDPDSATIWLTDPATPRERTAFATGFKNAYSLLPLGDGEILVGEVGEPIDGGDAPNDELNIVAEGEDGGWPLCSADQQPTVSLGATDEQCAATLNPIALFPPAATPTSVAAFDGGYLAALWVEGEVVRVPLSGGDPVTWFAGDQVKRPQHLLVLDDILLVFDHEQGRIHAVVPR